MQPNRRLSDIFPVSFRNGEQVRQFSKPCVHCGQMLNIQHMHGIACLLNDHIAIAASAKCPACGERFPVTCLINENKQVRRVVLPYFLFNPYLRVLKPVVISALPAKNTLFEPEKPDVPAVTPVSAVPLEIERAEEAVGRYRDKPIPAWVRVNGKQFTFERVAFEARTGDGEFLLDDCLVYRG